MRFRTTIPLPTRMVLFGITEEQFGEIRTKSRPEIWAYDASCHTADGTGRIGPNIVDTNYKYPRIATNKGEFEVIYGGAAGAMQPMGRRFDEDQILKIMAYVETLAAGR